VRKVTLLFYPLKRSEVIEDDDLLDMLVINFDELLINELYFSDATTNEQINDKIEMLRALNVVCVDSYRIQD